MRNGPIELLVDRSLSMKILISIILLIIKGIVQKMADGQGKVELMIFFGPGMSRSQVSVRGYLVDL